MKSSTISNHGLLSRPVLKFVLACTAVAALCAPQSIARGQIFVTEANAGRIGVYAESGSGINASLVTGLNVPTAIALSGSDLFVGNYNASGTVDRYTTAGEVVSAPLISGIGGPVGIAVSGSDLFVVHSGVVGKFTTSGATVNPSFIPSVSSPFGIAVSGNRLFVTSYGTDNHDGTLGVYDAATGATLNGSLIIGLYRPFSIAVSGEYLFVTSFGDNTVNLDGSIGKYTTSGATVNASLVTGLNGPLGIAVNGGRLYVVNNGDGFASNGSTIGQYDALTGAPLNASLISGLSAPWGVAVADLSFAGFLAPIGGADDTGGSFANPVRSFKMGSTIPVKFKTSPVLAGIHRLQVIKYSSATIGGSAIDATPQDPATTGDQFRWVDGEWHFNLDTKATGMSPGIWRFQATLSDGSQHSAWIQLK